MSNKGKHILFLVDFYAPHRGGVETVFSNIISRLLQRNYHITLITSRFDHSLPAKEIDGRFVIYRVGRGRVSYMRHAYRLGKQLLRSDETISLIHGSSYSGVRPTVLLAKKFKKPSLLTVHEVFGKLRYRFKGWKGWIYHLFEKSLFRIKADMYHCVSYYTFNSLRLLYGVADNRLCVIHNGVDDSWKNTSLHTSSSGEGFHILYYGHTGYSKGIDYLIQAIPYIIQKIPHAHITFHLIASKRLRSITKQIEKLGFPHVIVKPGCDQPQLQKIVAGADIVVAPSLAEGFGSVVSEVSSLGVPLVTTYAGAIPEASWGEVIYVPPSHVDDIVQAVYDVYTRKSTQKIIPTKEYSWDDTIDKLEKIYRNCGNIS